MSAVHTRATLAIQRKLERLELLHLRAHAEELQSELDAARAQLEATQDRLTYAEDLAESWREDAMRAIQDSGNDVGLTISGHLVAVAPEARAS